jgi:hypothetical protein
MQIGFLSTAAVSSMAATKSTKSSAEFSGGINR